MRINKKITKEEKKMKKNILNMKRKETYDKIIMKINKKKRNNYFFNRFCDFSDL